jgi:hypothetical protein
MNIEDVVKQIREEVYAEVAVAPIDKHGKVQLSRVELKLMMERAVSNGLAKAHSSRSLDLQASELRTTETTRVGDASHTVEHSLRSEPSDR